MSIERNELNQIKISYPQLFVNEEYYLDYGALMDISGLNSTTLFRVIKSLENVPIYRYKNRCYYRTDWCLRFWKWVGERK
jgi:hypothetical protein